MDFENLTREQAHWVIAAIELAYVEGFGARNDYTDWRNNNFNYTGTFKYCWDNSNSLVDLKQNLYPLEFTVEKRL